VHELVIGLVTGGLTALGFWAGYAFGYHRGLEDMGEVAAECTARALSKLGPLGTLVAAHIAAELKYCPDDVAGEVN
jgi:hypothetical protein